MSENWKVLLLARSNLGGTTFPRTLKESISNTTVHSIIKSHLHMVKQRQRIDDDGKDVKRLCEKMHGRAVLLRGKMDARLQACIRKVHEGGRAISALVVITGACEILLSYEKRILKNDIAVLLNLVYCQALFQVHSL